MPWGLIGILVLLVVTAALGVHARSRLAGSLLLFALSAASLVLLLLARGTSPAAGELVFMLPCLAVMLQSLRWAWRAKRLRPVAASSGP